MTATPTTLTYEQWLERNPEVAEAEVDCEECDGEGITNCDCCGSELVCDDCHGTGKIDAARQQYEAQVQADVIALERWKAMVNGQ